MMSKHAAIVNNNRSLDKRALVLTATFHSANPGGATGLSSKPGEHHKHQVTFLAGPIGGRVRAPSLGPRVRRQKQTQARFGTRCRLPGGGDGGSTQANRVYRGSGQTVADLSYGLTLIISSYRRALSPSGQNRGPEGRVPQAQGPVRGLWPPSPGPRD